MTTDTTQRIVVCDAGPVIHLDELGCLSLLSDFEQVFLPQSVREEIVRHREGWLRPATIPFVTLPCREIASESLMAMCQVFSLHQGEIDALAQMEAYPQALFLTDDCAARLVAERTGFRVHGTIGILVRSIRRGLKNPEEVLALLAELQSRSSLHIRPALLQDIIDKVEEKYLGDGNS